MSREQFLLKAAHCDQNAMTTAVPACRAMMLEIAEHWRKLAKTAKDAPERRGGDFVQTSD